MHSLVYFDPSAQRPQFCCIQMPALIQDDISWFNYSLFVSSSLFRAIVTYDDKSFIINGQRKILISGSIHYPRSTPEMWPPDLIQKAKDRGFDVIQTCVFWNGHDPSPGKVAMQGFVEKIVNTMKSEKLSELQGGPVIMSQMENEYCKDTMSLPRNALPCSNGGHFYLVPPKHVFSDVLVWTGDPGDTRTCREYHVWVRRGLLSPAMSVPAATCPFFCHAWALINLLHRSSAGDVRSSKRPSSCLAGQPQNRGVQCSAWISNCDLRALKIEYQSADISKSAEGNDQKKSLVQQYIRSKMPRLR
ncbi:hypothetical protein BUALT_Bualt07G0150500 [Buddleja alternifolia]|uniref:beta-galactosidase n=1 Tax=Buddleja alternifolia TaxID=168488 RepID=A0AAV6XAX3_9LAMI|nr:hypothetical protein BUALT_Bualt07G0150500 [Buddleja alternifolia]